MSLSVMVVGVGRVAAALARQLSASGHRVVVVDPRPTTAPPPATVSVEALTGDGTDPDVLEAAGIRTVDVVAAVSNDDAVNVAVAALARFEFAVPRTIARIVDPRHAWLFQPQTGVDVAVDQADLLTRLIVEEMSLGEVATLVKLRRGDLTLVEERVGPSSPAVGRAVGDLDLPPSCVVVSVLRGTDALAAGADLVLAAGDEVLAVVHASATGDLTAALGGA